MLFISENTFPRNFVQRNDSLIITLINLVINRSVEPRERRSSTGTYSRLTLRTAVSAHKGHALWRTAGHDLEPTGRPRVAQACTNQTFIWTQRSCEFNNKVWLTGPDSTCSGPWPRLRLSAKLMNGRQGPGWLVTDCPSLTVWNQATVAGWQCH